MNLFKWLLNSSHLTASLLFKGEAVYAGCFAQSAVSHLQPRGHSWLELFGNTVVFTPVTKFILLVVLLMSHKNVYKCDGDCKNLASHRQSWSTSVSVWFWDAIQQ